MIDLISRQAAIAIGLEEGAYGYVGVEELAALPPVEAVPMSCINEHMEWLRSLEAELAELKRMVSEW